VREEKGAIRGKAGAVRLQWDPDRFPNHQRHPCRRAVQLGMRGIESFRNGEDFLQVKDVTDFVESQRHLAESKKMEGLLVASELVYVPTSMEAQESVGIERAS